jgi:hypothetical protein
VTIGVGILSSTPLGALEVTRRLLKGRGRGPLSKLAKYNQSINVISIQRDIPMAYPRKRYSYGKQKTYSIQEKT